MDSTNAALAMTDTEVAGPAAVLRGTARGLEWNIDAHARTEAVVLALETKLAEAPTFFRGSNVRVVVDGGPLSNLCLVQLAELATRYELNIVEIGAYKAPLPPAVLVNSGPVPKLGLAEGSAPNAADEPGSPRRGSTPEWECGVFDDEEPTNCGATPLVEVHEETSAEPVMLAAADLIAVEPAAEAVGESFEEPTRTSIPRTLDAMPGAAAMVTEGTRLVVGPVRSGVILDHAGNLIVFGDVNPGAEVRATGNIVVLGRLRGTAHAAIGSDIGFILALRLEPQQLRIGRRVARAADNDTSSETAEIAYATGEQMIVERYQGRLPRNLATSI
jgi:septum site-determining protein MinC